MALCSFPYDYQIHLKSHIIILNCFTHEIGITPVQPQNRILVALTPMFAKSTKYLPAFMCVCTYVHTHISK